MAGITVRIDADISELSDTELIALLDQQPEIIAAKKQLAQEAVDYAQSIAPVDTGDYRDSIHVSVKGTKVAMVSADHKAHWIEYGTEHMPEHAVFARTEKEINGRT